MTEENEFKIAAIQMENTAERLLDTIQIKNCRIAIVEQENLHILSPSREL